MTTYAYEAASTTLLAIWPNGIGAVARPVARLHRRTDEADALRLARSLTDLSSTAWIAYTDPHLLELSSAAALRALRCPRLPRDGLVYVDPDPVLHCADVVGRDLHELGSAGVTRAVADDVAAELDAIERACRGDLSARARQAVALTRVDASPAQIAAADRLLHDVPMGAEALFSEVEPTAAAVAAVHWFAAAVEVTRSATGRDDPLTVLDDAATGWFDPETPAIVLDMLDAGNPPLVVAQHLVQVAVLAARGVTPALTPERAAEPSQTVLDPSRPARCLLERLTRAVQVLCLVYAEHLPPLGRSEQEHVESARHVFDDAVRAEALRRADRLLQTAPSPAA